jgi:hypothetical protein
VWHLVDKEYSLSFEPEVQINRWEQQGVSEGW